MDDLVTWLKAALDEDERDAHDAMAVILPVGMFSEDEHPQQPVDWPLRQLPAAVQQHIARWDPPRVLRKVAAERRILDDITARLDPREPGGGWESADAETDGMASRTVRLLALPLDDRPGYREEWRP